MDLTAFPDWELDPESLKALPASERVEAEMMLRELEELVKQNPLWGYRPHAKQRAYHDMRTFIGAFIGGNRSGKTFGGCADDTIQLVDRDLLPPWLAQYKVFDEFYGRVIVPGQAESLDALMPIFQKLLPKGQLWKGEWERAYDQRRRKLQLANGNWIDFMSHDQNVDRFASVLLHRVRFDEEPPGSKGQAIYNESLMRTVGVKGGQIRFTMTPLFGLSWSYHLLTKDGEPRNDEKVRTVTVSMGDNPHNTPDQMEQALEGLSVAERDAREHGHFVHLAGLVFPQFDRERHMIDDELIPRDKTGEPLWDFYDGIDPGYGHPMGYVLLAVDSYGVKRVCRAWKMAGMTVADCAKRIFDTRLELGVKPRYTIIDPSARNRNHATGRSVQLEYAEEGIHTMPGQNSREAGLNRVATHLEHDKLLVWRSQDALRDEFETHRWKTRRGEEQAEPEVIKVNDDILDPLRYVLMSRPPLKGVANTEEPKRGPEKMFEDSLRKLAGRKKGRNTWGAPRFVR